MSKKWVWGACYDCGKYKNVKNIGLVDMNIEGYRCQECIDIRKQTDCTENGLKMLVTGPNLSCDPRWAVNRGIMNAQYRSRGDK